MDTSRTWAPHLRTTTSGLRRGGSRLRYRRSRRRGWPRRVTIGGDTARGCPLCREIGDVTFSLSSHRTSLECAVHSPLPI